MLWCPDCYAKMPSATEACPSCGWTAIFVEGIPVLLSTADQKSSHFADYRANYDLIAEVDLHNSIMSVPYKRAMAAKLVALLGDLSGKRICDIGTGRGELLEEILTNSRPEFLLTVDIALSYLLSQRQPDISCAVANAENLPYRNEFDLVLAIDVVEHLTNPGAFLYSVNRALRDSGRIVLRTPYLENPMQYAPQMGCPYRLVHLRAFDKAIMRVYLESAGFKIRSMRFDGFHWRNIRPFLTRRRSRVDRVLNSIFSWFYPNDTSITLEHPAIARFLCRPLELLTVAEKVHDLPDPSPLRNIPGVAVERSEETKARLERALREKRKHESDLGEAFIAPPSRRNGD